MNRTPIAIADCQAPKRCNSGQDCATPFACGIVRRAIPPLGSHNICDGCETCSHCSRYGCLDKASAQAAAERHEPTPDLPWGWLPDPPSRLMTLTVCIGLAIAGLGAAAALYLH